MDFFCNSYSFYAAATLATLCLATIFIIFAWWDGRKKRHPVVGTVLHQLFNFSTVHDYHTQLATKYRSFRIIGCFRSEVYVIEPANVEHILKTNFQNYGKGEYHNYLLKDLFGDGIFAVDGEKWKQQRKLISYDFSTRVLRDSSSAVFRKNAAKLAQFVAGAAKDGQTLELQGLFTKSTLDSIFKVGFGTDLDSLYGSSDEGVKFSRALIEADTMLFYRFVDIFWEIKRYFNIGSEAKFKDNIRIVHDFVSKLVQAKMNEYSTCKTDMHEKEDLVTRFLAISKEEDGCMNENYLRDIILNILLAGTDTTGATLSWFFYMLCKNPIIQDKIAQEVDGIINPKNRNNMDDVAESIDEEALNKAYYLHAALTETLRLYPTVAVDGKLCHSDDTLPDGFNVQRGDSIAYVPYSMGRMKFIWGEDAEEYKPERWLDDNGIFQLESPFKFTAFQAGPRICIGKDFAYRQMKIFAAVLLHFFSFRLADAAKQVKYKTMLTLQIDGGLYVLASYRKQRLI